MIGIIPTRRGSSAPRSQPDLDRIILYPRWETSGPDDLEVPTAGPPPGRQAAAEPVPGPRTCSPKSRKARKSDVERARRLLAAVPSFIDHPSFDDPSARDAILAPSPGIEPHGPDGTPVTGDVGAGSSRDTRIPSREREAHLFRKMNYLKCLAYRIRDRIDPESPDPGDLDEVERLQTEALKLKNQLIETHLRLVVSVAKKHVKDGYDLPERISDGTFALMRAVDRFDFARGNRFSTYATWAIINELVRHDRREKCHDQSLALYLDTLTSRESESEWYERELAQAERRATVERLLRRLDRRERRIIVKRNGIGGVPEQTLKQISLDLGISKERVRQLEERAHAKLRSFARAVAIEPSNP